MKGPTIWRRLYNECKFGELVGLLNVIVNQTELLGKLFMSELARCLSPVKRRTFYQPFYQLSSNTCQLID